MQTSTVYAIRLNTKGTIIDYALLYHPVHGWGCAMRSGRSEKRLTEWLPVVLAHLEDINATLRMTMQHVEEGRRNSYDGDRGSRLDG